LDTMVVDSTDTTLYFSSDEATEKYVFSMDAATGAIGFGLSM